MQIKGEIRRTRTSLVGGIVIAIFVFVLARLCFLQLGIAGTAAILGPGLIALAAGSYVRLADL
jgi:hypothetical protein